MCIDFWAAFVGRNARDVDDLVQQTFIEVTRAAARFRSDSQVKTWMFGIAANVAGIWFSTTKLKWKTFINADCNFGYRESILKNEIKDQYIITTVVYKIDQV